MPFWIWSKSSADNASIDTTINFAEGQSPSSLNNSDRAVMARLAEYRDDISGILPTSGTSTAYTMSTNQGLPAVPTDGQLIAFNPHVTNGINPTLVADGGTIYPIQTSPGVAVGAATLIQNTPYTAMFSQGNAAWLLRSFFGNPYAVPIGGIMPYCGDTAPNSNFILPFGQALSRTTYAVFFALVGTRFGVGDGATTFNAPDLRGRVIAVIDNLGGAAANRLTSATMAPNGNTIGASGGAETETLTAAQVPTINSANVAQAISVTSDNNLIDATGALQDFNPVTASGFRAPNNTASLRQQTSRANNAIAVTSSNTGGQAHPNIQATLALGCILRII